jgi:HD superfamily phosphodiesterase
MLISALVTHISIGDAILKRLIVPLLACIALFSTSTGFAQPKLSAAGIPLDAPWKVQVYEFAASNLEHSAWGLQHYERNYLMSMTLAHAEGLKVDTDVLFAAAFLHDMGVFEPYVIAGAEHSQTAADAIETVLAPSGFPMAKIDAVKAVVLAHMYYAAVPDNPTAQVHHDADTLDFLGTIGVTRIVSLTSRHPWAENLQTAIATLQNFAEQLPPTLITDTAKGYSKTRVMEMKAFITTLLSQTEDGHAL